MPTYNKICTTKGLSIANPIKMGNSGFELYPSNYNNPLNENFHYLAGLAQTIKLESDPFFAVYSKQEEDGSASSEKEAENFQLFLYSLWFVKDNSADIDMFFIHEVGDKTDDEQFNDRMKFRRRTTMATLADGGCLDITFTDEEIEQAIGFSNLLVTQMSSDHIVEKEVREGFQLSDYDFKPYNEGSRTVRALNFWIIARTNSFLPFKITMYVAIFECLFTTTTTQIARNVSERLTNYIGGNAAAKRSNLKIIRDAYTIRSDYMHGQKLSKYKTRDQLIGLSTSTDEIVRLLLTKVLNDPDNPFSKTNSDLHRYFTPVR